MLQMPDIYTPAKRSEVMRAVRRLDTPPEKRVRSLLHRLGFRFRLHREGLPGRPDIVLPRFRTVIFVHGCFWHRHRNCRKATTPASRHEFWMTKFSQNRRRDARVRRQLEDAGWRVLIVWECQTLHPARLQNRLLSALGPNA
jgi:DNA mismatch endonuclease (patch repair protein)